MNIKLQYNTAGYEVPQNSRLDTLIIGRGPHFRDKSLVVKSNIGRGLVYFTYHS